MSLKIHQVHAVYTLIKPMSMKVPWLVINSLPWVFSLEKISLPFRDTKMEVEIVNGTVIYHIEAEIGLLPL